MANELVHKSQGTSLTQAEYENVDAHILNSQATGDTIYASSATQLSRLAVGSTGQVLNVASGIPAWATLAYFIRQPTATTVHSILVLSGQTRTDLANDTLRASPLWIPEPQTWDRIGVQVDGAGGAGANIRVGIYANGNCAPTGAKLAGGNELDATGTGILLDTISYSFTTPGLYWLVANSDDATIDWYCVSTCFGIVDSNLSPYHGYTVASAYGALPTWPGGEGPQYNVPVPFYRILSYP